MKASEAFWNTFYDTFSFLPGDVNANGRLASTMERKAQLQTSKMRLRMVDIGWQYTDRGDDGEERMLGDKRDMFSEETESRFEISEFENRQRSFKAEQKGESSSDWEDSDDDEGQRSTSYRWSDEAEAFANLVRADMALEKRRKKEIMSKSFILNTFKTIRLKQMQIASLDLGMHAFPNLVELSLSGNPLGSLTVVPATVQILNVYDCSISEFSVAVGASNELRHLGIGYNRLNEECLVPIAEAFPHLLSLDLCYNELQSVDAIVQGLGSSVHHVVFLGNPIFLQAGYFYRMVSSLHSKGITSIDGKEVRSEDGEESAQALQNLLQRVKHKSEEEDGDGIVLEVELLPVHISEKAAMGGLPIAQEQGEEKKKKNKRAEPKRFGTLPRCFFLGKTRGPRRSLFSERAQRRADE